uniref:Uncharacterized protein n=1 Tax=Romanomermis culicivorax TaxID=13658 RepID=A0A915KVE0_ROMCU
MVFLVTARVMTLTSASISVGGETAAGSISATVKSASDNAPTGPKFFRKILADRMSIRMGEKIGSHDTLIVTIVVENYTLDHMFTEHGFHSKDYWTVGIDNGAIGHFDFTTYRELERLLVECAFD